MKEKKICIIGDILIDYTLISSGGDKMRLGGIFHAARGAWALDLTYELAYFAPAYLDDQIKHLASEHYGNVFKIGDITGSPNLVLIKEVKEIGDQGYELVLRNEIKYEYQIQSLLTNSDKYTDILIFTGGYDLEFILETVSSFNARIHIDVSNDIDQFSVLSSLSKKFNSIFLSTSSQVFLKTFSGDIISLTNDIRQYCQALIFKENRGGSRCFNFEGDTIFHIASQTRTIQHSVGVGDNYDIAYISKIDANDQENSLNYASWFAMEYALTTYPSDFKRGIERLNLMDIASLKQLGGIKLAWEDRQKIDIYIAAPDFDYINREKLQLLINSLKYHNFSVRLPIQENGQLKVDATSIQKRLTCSQDIELLMKCKIVVAVLLYDDPGTLIELGYAIAAKIPTIVYDPYNIAKNCILVSLPNFVGSDLDEIISQVFFLSNKL